MKLERVSPASCRLTLHAYELAALISAARWAVEGGDGEMAPEARRDLEQLLVRYDAALTRAEE